MGICGSKTSNGAKKGQLDVPKAPAIVLTTATPGGSAMNVEESPSGHKPKAPVIDPTVENLIKIQPSKHSLPDTLNQKPSLSDCSFSKLVSQEGVKIPRSLPPDVAFEIEECKDSKLFVGTVVSQVMVDYCEKCFIYIAPTSGSAFIRDCQDCVIVVAAHQVRFKKCKRLKVLLYSTTQPVIESCSEIEIGCFQYNYVDLEGQFRKAGLPVLQNEWSDIYDFTPSNNASSPNWKLLSISEIMDIPIRFPESTLFELTKDEQNRFPKECLVKELSTRSQFIVPLTQSKVTIKNVFTTMESQDISAPFPVDLRLFVTADPEKETLEILRKFPEFVEIMGTRMIKFKDGPSREPFKKSHIPVEIYDRTHVIYCAILRFQSPQVALDKSNNTRRTDVGDKYGKGNEAELPGTFFPNQSLPIVMVDNITEDATGLVENVKGTGDANSLSRVGDISTQLQVEGIAASIGTNLTASSDGVSQKQPISSNDSKSRGSEGRPSQRSRRRSSVSVISSILLAFQGKKTRSVDMTPDEIEALVSAQNAILGQIPAYSHLSYLSSSAKEGRDDLLALSSLILS